ncbi:MAG: hypothetical protein LBH05_01575 [Deferribacteraceae bacterium]|jgi:hypothetical protein|nr:hypothetical protein [Deferribacteraceae bacterium]
MAEIKIDKTDEAALAEIKAVYDDKEAEINGNIYTFTKTTHQKRLSVFAYMTKIQRQITDGDLSFFADKEFKAIQNIIDNVVMYEGSLLSKLPEHWEEHEEEFTAFYMMAMGVFSYPFLRGRKQG